MRSAGEADRRAARRLFSVLLLLALLFFVFLAADRRLLRGHETRVYYELQYAFLSGCPQPGSVPLWIPFAAHGVVSSPELFSQAGLLQSALLLAGPALAGSNFLTLFALGLLMEELLFVAGCWMLARRHFASPLTAFFVSVAALGSAFWADHLWLNFHILYALPLLLALLHGFLDGGSRKQLLLAGNLAAVQTLGCPPGAGLAAPLAAVLYFLGLRLVLRERFPAIGWTRKDSLWILAILATGIPAFATATLGTGERVTAMDGSRPGFHDLLVYAGLANPLRYLDFLVGATPSLAWSLYCGALTVGFALVALMTLPRDVLLRLAAALPAGLLALGAAFLLLYSVAPSLRPSQAPAFGTPFVRLFAVFLAGAGFQRMLDQPVPAPLRRAGRSLLTAALLLALLSWTAALHSDQARQALQLLVSGEPGRSLSTPALEPWSLRDRAGPSLVPDLLGASALFAGLAGALLLLRASTPRAAPLALTLILVLHPLDVFSWKFRMTWLETFPANPAQRDLQRLEPPAFVPQREDSLEATPRFQAFHEISPGHPSPHYADRKSDPWPVAAYWGADLSSPPGIAGAWMKPWDRTREEFSPDKLRFFSAAHPPPEGQAPGTGHLSLPHQVLEFNPNALTLQVDAPAEGAWLLYADVYSPSWRATVNGAPREIRKADVSYKSLRLEPGRSIVSFRHHAPLRTLAFFLVGLNALFWLLWTLRAAVLLAFRGDA